MSSNKERDVTIGNVHKILLKVGRVVPGIRSRTNTQTNKQTDTVVTILGSPIGGGVMRQRNCNCGTCIAPPAERPRAHHKAIISLYNPGIRSRTDKHTNKLINILIKLILQTFNYFVAAGE